jgi:hypothetical protein
MNVGCGNAGRAADGNDWGNENGNDCTVNDAAAAVAPDVLLVTTGSF